MIGGLRVVTIVGVQKRVTELILHWPIRHKLRVGLGAMAVTIALLFGSALYGLYAYRSLVKSLNARSAELPLADQIGTHVSELRVILAQARERALGNDDTTISLPKLGEDDIDPASEDPPTEQDFEERWAMHDYRERYYSQFEHFKVSLAEYREQLDFSIQRTDARIGDDHKERATLDAIDAVVGRIDRDRTSIEHFFGHIDVLRSEVETLNELVGELPSYLQDRLRGLAGEVRSQYRWGIILAWATFLIGLVVMGLAIHAFRITIARPLGQLVYGSRRVAGGDFDHRIALASRDEIGELAEAMNAMTQRFQTICKDLDSQVRDRTREVVRSEQLASVGFLAAGVAHEINNPLASIALCAESLEGRMVELMGENSDPQSAEWPVVRSYLDMIQREAFRCKQITEKLLDFSRMGDSQRHATELRDLVGGVIEMLQHLGRYNDKQVVLTDGDPVVADLNPQELKQVVLNLITNGLDSLDPGGTVTVSVDRHDGKARVTVADNGCGMTDEVIQHLFEPFFTRRRGGQGTGLGLSISYRIVTEHGGQIAVESKGPGCGSQFIVTLPLTPTSHQSQAA